MPTITTHTVPKNYIPVSKAAAALAIVPTMANELLLLAALQELQSQNLCTDVHMFDSMPPTYAKQLCTKLAAQEEKHAWMTCTAHK